MEGEKPFDFKAHEQETVTAYLKEFSFYEDLASSARRMVEECVKSRKIKVHSVQARAKEPASLGRKASEPAEGDPSRPKYSDPLRQITDLAGVRIITYFPSTLEQLDRMLADEFKIVERSDKGAHLVAEDRFGYQSIHYLISLTEQRSSLPEYQRFAKSIVEIQIRTILQHAWAEIEHDIQYKSTSVIPSRIRRRFVALAGLLEIADRDSKRYRTKTKSLPSTLGRGLSRET